MTRPYGMASAAFDAYISACFAAKINPEHTSVGGKRVIQTIGNAVESAGTHQVDGMDKEGNPYSAAVDLSVRWDLTSAQKNTLQQALWTAGFCAYHRQEPQFSAEHLHCVYVGVPMKLPLRHQVHDFLAHKSGLVSEHTDAFVAANLTDAQAQHICTLFLSCNPEVG